MPEEPGVGHTTPRKRSKIGRPPRVVPPKTDRTAGEIAQAMLSLPADHKFTYNAKTVYHCAVCKRMVEYPETLYRDGRCSKCRKAQRPPACAQDAGAQPEDHRTGRAPSGSECSERGDDGLPLQGVWERGLLPRYALRGRALRGVPLRMDWLTSIRP